MGDVLCVIGLGYVGLPVALEASRSGLRVIGYDTSEDVIVGLNRGVSHVDDIETTEVAEMFDNGFTATVDAACIAEAEVIVICVPTPLTDDGVPDLAGVELACRSVSANLQRDALVVLESTTYPGTTDGTVREILEAGSGLSAGDGFALAYSPERIDPGNPVYGLRNTPKVVGGLTPSCTRRAVDFYSRIVDTVVPTVGLREAEMAKLLENTYRHVNIALMNEMAVFCHELGVDLWAAIDAAGTKPFGYEAFYPGPGVGGHCIPIDPNYLSWVVRSLGYRFRFVELAQEISNRMPAYVAKRVQDALNSAGKAVNGSVVLLLGVTYKANVSDQRESPARPLVGHLLEMGAEVQYFDPYADSFSGREWELKAEGDLDAAVRCADLVVLLQGHDQILESDALNSAQRILDTRGVLSGENVERL
ncbi:MAG: nucleotide sugar dehydrogenase [Actinomycetota bacterium]|nr:nucleotide sugar dehydrogenase [Actinomycetota bacterium]